MIGCSDKYSIIENSYLFQDFQDYIRIMQILSVRPELLDKMVKLPALIHSELAEFPEYIKLTSPAIDPTLYPNSNALFEITIKTSMENDRYKRLSGKITEFLGENVIISFPFVNCKDTGIKILDYAKEREEKMSLFACISRAYRFTDEEKLREMLIARPVLLRRLTWINILIKHKIGDGLKFIKLISPLNSEKAFHSGAILEIEIKADFTDEEQQFFLAEEIQRALEGYKVIVTFVPGGIDGIKGRSYSDCYRELLKNSNQKIIEGLINSPSSSIPTDLLIELIKAIKKKFKEQTATTQELPPEPVTNRNEKTISLMHEGVDKAFSILSERGKSYNHSTPILSYFIHGETDIIYEIHKKIIRMDNSLKAEGEGKNVDERIEDNLIDTINYLLFLYAYRQEKKGADSNEHC